MGLPSWAPRRWPIFLGLLWLAAIAWGFNVIWRYESTPGASAPAPALWPKDSLIARAQDRATLVMLAHPRCPCTQASLDALAHIMTRAPSRPRAHVLFYQPADQPESWTETASWRAAAAIAGVAVSRDKGGLEAARFSAATSGHVVLYDPEGRLLFSGGVTGLRGHIGDNVGRRAVVARLGQEKTDIAGTPVLGCALKQNHAEPNQTN